MKKERTLHQQVRVIYRACRRIYGIEKTQDECLKVFKVAYPEICRLKASESEREVFDNSIRPQLERIMKSWHPQKQLRELCDRVDSLIGLPFDCEREQLIQILEDITPVAMKIRKLTPRECFRLMDVDDLDIDKIQNAGISKSSQYKLAGNSIVVACLYYIFDKMFIHTKPDFKAGDQLTLF